jgi:hypothetical protein
MSRSTTHLVMDSGAHIVRRAGRKIKHNHAKTIAGENLLGGRVYILSLYQKNLAIASGATPIGSAGHAPDKKAVSRKNSTERKEERRKRRRRNWSL